MKLKPITKRLIAKIFQDGRVVDFDLSAWDKRLRLVVVAHDILYKENVTGKPFNVDFQGVVRFTWKSNQLKLKPSPGSFFVWNTIEAKIRAGQNTIIIDVRDCGPGPSVRIECKQINVTDADYDAIEFLNPNRKLTGGGPLLRPSLESLSKRLRLSKTLSKTS